MHSGAARLEATLEEHVGDALRRIIFYEFDDFAVVSLRDDLVGTYAEAELEEIVREARFESIEAPMYEGMYTPAHGEFQCQLKWYETVVELNFALSQSSGVAISIDADGMHDAPDLVADLRAVIDEEFS